MNVKDVEEALEVFDSGESDAEPALKYDVPQKFELDDIKWILNED